MRVPTYRFGEFELDPAARELRRHAQRVRLPPKSFDCLAYLIAHRHRAVGRDELIAAVWGRVDISDTVVAQTVLRVRKALGDSGESSQRLVRTVPRFGYHWVAPVEETLHVDADPSTQVPRIENIASGVDVATGPVPATASRSRIRASPWSIAAAIVVLAAAIGIVVFAPGSHRSAPPIDATANAASVLVLPVRVSSSETEDAWVRLGAMDYLATRLRQDGMHVVPSEQALHLGEQLDASHPLDDDDARTLQRLGGVRWVIAPRAEHDGRGWRVRLAIFDGGRERLIEAHGVNALIAASAAADSWLRRVHPDSPRNRVGPSAFDQRLQQIDAELMAGQLDAARRLIESATPDERAEPAVRVREGQVQFRSGRLDEAATAFERTLADAARSSPEVRAKALMGLGAVGIRRGQPAAAQAYYASALDVVNRIARTEDPVLPGHAYNGLGVALVQQGHMEDAIRNLGLARLTMQRAGSLIEAASVGTNLGIVEQQRGHYQQAVEEFDRAIAVFELFDVHDYMAAALMAKSATQMDMVQPDAAASSIARASALKEAIEDRLLSVRMALTVANVALARGRLGEVARALAELRSLDVTESDMAFREAQLRQQLARGATNEAAALARAPVAQDATVPGSLALACVQALIASNDIPSAARWVSYRERMDAARHGLDWDIADAFLAQAEARSKDALAMANNAAARVEEAGSPNERVQAGVFKARLLRMQGRSEAAVPVLADLDAFASTDYRVAWETLALYRALHDEAMANRAMLRVQALRGERDILVEPAL